MQLKSQPNSCFVNNYFDFGLKAWQANMDIQAVFNEYKAVTYMSRYFSKTEDQCSQTMKQAAKEAFENNTHHHDTMKTIANAYLSNRAFMNKIKFEPYGDLIDQAFSQFNETIHIAKLKTIKYQW